MNPERNKKLNYYFWTSLHTVFCLYKVNHHTIAK